MIPQNLEDLRNIALAAERLVRCKGRHHSEQNMIALAALFGVTLPPSETAPISPIAGTAGSTDKGCDPADERAALGDVGAAALEAEAARKARAEARTALRKMRLKWQDETGGWYDKDECEGEEGADEMEAAVVAREQAQKSYRAAYSRLRNVIRRHAIRVAAIGQPATTGGTKEQG